jgi:hypothetical protein
VKNGRFDSEKIIFRSAQTFPQNFSLISSFLPSWICRELRILSDRKLFFKDLSSWALFLVKRREEENSILTLFCVQLKSFKTWWKKWKITLWLQFHDGCYLLPWNFVETAGEWKIFNISGVSVKHLGEWRHHQRFFASNTNFLEILKLFPIPMEIVAQN